MFRPVVTIIKFYHSTHLRLFYTIRVAACLMWRSQHQPLCWSIVPLYWVCVCVCVCVNHAIIYKSKPYIIKNKIENEKHEGPVLGNPLVVPS